MAATSAAKEQRPTADQVPLVLRLESEPEPLPPCRDRNGDRLLGLLNGYRPDEVGVVELARHILSHRTALLHQVSWVMRTASWGLIFLLPYSTSVLKSVSVGLRKARRSRLLFRRGLAG